MIDTCGEKSMALSEERLLAKGREKEENKGMDGWMWDDEGFTGFSEVYVP